MKRKLRYITTLVVMAAMAMTASAGTTTTFAYASRDAEPDPSGTGKKETYDVAIALTNPALFGKAITAIDIPVIPSAKVSNLSVWVTSELRLELVDGRNTNIVDKRWDMEMPASGQLQFVSQTLDEPYIIPEGGLYVGYSLTVDATDRSEGTQVPIVGTDGAKAGSFFLHTSRSFINWADRSEELNVIALTQVELEGEFYINAATLGEIPYSYLAAGVAQTVSVPVHNIGMTPITSLAYTTRLGDETCSGTLELDHPIQAVFAYAEDVAFPLPLAHDLGDCTVKVEVTGVNGLDNDADEMTVASGSGVVLKYVPRHLALVEEFTGTWCGWCPAGYVAMEKMSELYPDFIGIAYHDRDPMTMREGYPIIASGFPQVAISRRFVTHPYEATGLAGAFTLPQVWEQYCSGFVPVGIELDAAWDEDSRTVTVNSSVEWVLPPDDPDADYRMQYVLVADDLTGTGRAWSQHNYYCTEPMTPFMEQFCNGDSYVAGLHYNDVAILATGTSGVPGSIVTTEPGVPNEYTHVFDTHLAVNASNDPIPFHRHKLRVIAFLLKGEGYGTVVNAAKCNVTVDPSGIELMPDGGKQVESVDYYDLQGRRVAMPTRGYYLRSVRFADGSVLTDKVLL